MIQNCFSKDTFILTCIVLFCKWFFHKKRRTLPFYEELFLVILFSAFDDFNPLSAPKPEHTPEKFFYT